MFGFNEKIPSTPCGKGTTRKILNYKNDLMIVEVSFETGGVGDVHTHPHQQISYVAKGSFAFELDGEVQIIKQGDSVLY